MNVRATILSAFEQAVVNYKNRKPLTKPNPNDKKKQQTVQPGWLNRFHHSYAETTAITTMREKLQATTTDQAALDCVKDYLTDENTPARNYSFSRYFMQQLAEKLPQYNWEEPDTISLNSSSEYYFYVSSQTTDDVFTNGLNLTNASNVTQEVNANFQEVAILLESNWHIFKLQGHFDTHVPHNKIICAWSCDANKDITYKANPHYASASIAYDAPTP